MTVWSCGGGWEAACTARDLLYTQDGGYINITYRASIVSCEEQRISSDVSFACSQKDTASKFISE